ncbi:MAG: hypothetical protein R2794_05135 [Chitinophagales bacterium]
MNNSKTIKELTDQEILEEFVKRFKCDGALLVYLDSNTEIGLGRWRNSNGKKWVSQSINILESLNKKKYSVEELSNGNKISLINCI